MGQINTAVSNKCRNISNITGCSIIVAALAGVILLGRDHSILQI